MEQDRKPMIGPPTILITGASSGIGRATATLLTERGYRVFGTSRRPGQVELASGYPLLPLDVHSPESIDACVQTVLGETGRIDVLINNAGLIGPAGACEETGMDQVRDLFETNFFGVVQMTKAVLPVMRAQGGGRIINISSVCGRICAPPYFVFYGAAKHALEGYSEGLRYEVRPFNIQVAMIEPGYTSTDIGGTIRGPRQSIEAYESTRAPLVMLDLAGIRYGTPPEAVANKVLHLIHHPNPPLRTTVGSDSQAVLLLRHWLPYNWFERLIEWMFFSWRPRQEKNTVPTPNELRLHRFLFHRPTRDWSLRAAAVSLILFVAAGATVFLACRDRSRRGRPGQ